jgi:DNA polymerase elongation subunit (family B)
MSIALPGRTRLNQTKKKFERFGFVRVDKNNDSLVAYYAQK